LSFHQLLNLQNIELTRISAIERSEHMDRGESLSANYSRSDLSKEPAAASTGGLTPERGQTAYSITWHH